MDDSKGGGGLCGMLILNKNLKMQGSVAVWGRKGSRLWEWGGGVWLELDDLGGSGEVWQVERWGHIE